MRLLLLLFAALPGPFIEELAQGLVRELGLKVEVAGSAKVPPEAYDPSRRQYRAEAFLPLLSPWQKEPADMVLGITAVDLFVPRLHFVFGLADPGTHKAVISLARLDPRFYGRPPDPELLKIRTLKEAVHEVGHLLGLPHCQNPRCIMFFSNTLGDTDRKGPGFCPACRGKLTR
jgi:archaemetzincin